MKLKNNIHAKKFRKYIVTKIFYYHFTKGKSINFYHLFARAVTTFIMPFCLFIRIKL